MGRSRIAQWETPAGWRASDGCMILGCGLPGIARGMCWNHYQRARRGQAVFVYLRKSKTGCQMVEAKFGPESIPFSQRRMERIKWQLSEDGLVSPEPNTGCWLWLGDIHPNGYALIGKCTDQWNRWAHRAALFVRGVDLERRNRKRHVRHLCNQPACVNPAHLVYGTAKENMADRSERYRRGEIKAPKSSLGPWKLTRTLVEYIREAHALGVTKNELKRDLSLNWGTIDRAIRGDPFHDKQAAQAA